MRGQGTTGTIYRVVLWCEGKRIDVYVEGNHKKEDEK